MEIGSAITASVGIVTFGGLALSIIKYNRNSSKTDSKPNPDSKSKTDLNNKYVLRNEYVAYCVGFEKQVLLMVKSLSKEIEFTRNTLVGDIGDLRKMIQKN